MTYQARILVVDDDPALLEQAEMILEDEYEVSLAVSGKQAVSFLERGQDADLILLDVLMPEMDGFKTMEAIREIPGCSEIPIIFLTSLTDSESELQCLASGAADYIPKPFDPRILTLRIARRLQNRCQLDNVLLEQLPEPLTEADRKSVV